jgi:hypothetical protein
MTDINIPISHRTVKPILLTALLFVVGLKAWAAGCTAPEFHQFDFWAGDWDVFETGGSTQVAHAQVDSILEGCVLREDYQDTTGHHGQSFTIYDAARKVWHQTWVTNRGELLMIEGTLVNGEITLSGVQDGKTLVRGTWKPVKEGVREVAVKSADGGKIWTPWFDLMFRPHRARR